MFLGVGGGGGGKRDSIMNDSMIKWKRINVGKIKHMLILYHFTSILHSLGLARAF